MLQSNFILFVVRMKASTIIPSYRMREFVTTNEACLAISTDNVCTLNLQHNCFDGKCQVKKTKVVRIERQDTIVRRNEVCHTDRVKYILNSASFHAPEEHRRMACLSISRVQPAEVVNGMHKGFEIWRKERD
ncbi:hypothetical protein VP01_61g10 [Puccinia sorghi]|uniref:Uncharacterized protein n=1 Tax=Puccinia sorghi TaxID=27349 RepID=A0A0L6UHI0_9BASI|nr:hypothetical protein VP01_61g10 [Puccinia sorghi]